MVRRNTIEDFFALVDTKDGDDEACWPWLGDASTQYKDRGYFSFEGKRWLVYRLMYYLVHGELPVENAMGEQLVIRHKCDNSLCCNPKHLVLGTRSENEQDKYLNDRAGVPVAVVREVKRLLQTTDYSQEFIARYVGERYNTDVSRSAVRDIKLGLRRANIDDARTSQEIIDADYRKSDDETIPLQEVSGNGEGSSD